MPFSDFISSDTIAHSIVFEQIETVDSNGLTCDCFIVRISGKNFFMKKLKDEFVGNLTYRSLLKKEFETGSKIHHTNLAEYISINDDEHGYYILMENIVGTTLDKFIASHPDHFKSRKNLDRFFSRLIDVVKCLHANHVVYSDLKPENIMVTQVNADVKLIDLGFCYTDAYTNTAGTTKGYSAPEQIANGTLNVTTDIYAIGGIIKYIAENQVHNLPSVYRRIMLKCQRPNQSERFQSADEILHLINRRRHTIRRLLLLSVVVVALFVGWRALIHNEAFLSWWDSFQIFSPSVDYDAEFEGSYYRLISEQDRTCMAVGQTTHPNVYLHDEVVISGKTYRLTEIADSAFYRKSYIKSVYLPEGIQRIGKCAFYECKKLTVIELPNSVARIDDYAFYGCNNAQYLNLSPRLTKISKGAFAGCAFRKVVIPEGVTDLKLDAFGNCYALAEVELPSTLRRIERGVFWNCQSLKRIDLPAQLEHIGEFSFFGCDSLTNIYNFAVTPQIVPPIHRNPTQITLHVPEQSVDKYRQADFWREMNIVPISTDI